MSAPSSVDEYIAGASKEVQPMLKDLRDRGCRFPGCDRPPAWTEGHHILHWTDGGRTELENLVALCRLHHRAVHEQGWRIHMADGIPVVEPPP